MTKFLLHKVGSAVKPLAVCEAARFTAEGARPPVPLGASAYGSVLMRTAISCDRAPPFLAASAKRPDAAAFAPADRPPARLSSTDCLSFRRRASPARRWAIWCSLSTYLRPGRASPPHSHLQG